MNSYPIKGTAKTTRKNKVVVECLVSELDVHQEWYVGKIINVDGLNYNVTGVGQPFGTHGNIRVYLYTDAIAHLAAKNVTRAQKEAQFDSIINEGGEGFNPYR